MAPISTTKKEPYGKAVRLTKYERLLVVKKIVAPHIILKRCAASPITQPRKIDKVAKYRGAHRN